MWIWKCPQPNNVPYLKKNMRYDIRYAILFWTLPTSRTISIVESNHPTTIMIHGSTYSKSVDPVLIRVPNLRAHTQKSYKPEVKILFLFKWSPIIELRTMCVFWAHCPISLWHMASFFLWGEGGGGSTRLAIDYFNMNVQSRSVTR